MKRFALCGSGSVLEEPCGCKWKSIVNTVKDSTLSTSLCLYTFHTNGVIFLQIQYSSLFLSCGVFGLLAHVFNVSSDSSTVYRISFSLSLSFIPAASALYFSISTSLSQSLFLSVLNIVISFKSLLTIVPVSPFQYDMQPACHMSLSLYILKALSVLTALMLYSVLQACYTGYERI